MELLIAALYLFGLFYTLWILYLAVMNLKRVRNLGLLHPVVKFLGYPILAVGIFLDVFLNIFVLTVLFLDPPKDLTISGRLSRYLKNPSWRTKVAKPFEYLLDPFDPDGDHI
jgi:hypothetical protein